MILKANIAKLAMLAAVSTAAGLMLNGVNAKADTTVNDQSAIQQQANNTSTSSYTQNNVQLYSNNLIQTQTQAATASTASAQNINIPAGYTLDAVRNVQNTTQANDLEKISIHNAIDKLNANQAAKKKQIFCLRKWDLIRFLEEKRLWKISICKTRMK